MKSIRGITASLLLAAGLAVSQQAPAQSVAMAYTAINEPGIPVTSTAQQRDEVIRLLSAHLGLWTASDPNQYPYKEIVTDDVVFEYPYANDESVRHIQGSGAVAKALQGLASLAANWQFSDLRLFETPHPDIFFVAYKATAVVPETQHVYSQTYLARVTVRDGKIANYYELWDRKAEFAAFSATSSVHN